MAAGSASLIFNNTTGTTTASALVLNSTNLALGCNAGLSQLTNAIAIGNLAGTSGQKGYAVAIGTQAGSNLQGSNAISIGYQAGLSGQQSNAVAIGNVAGYSNQGTQSIAIGIEAGQWSQGSNGVSIGFEAGQSNQGQYSVAIGYKAGSNAQPAYSIALNASTTALNPNAAGFFVSPVRVDNTQAQALGFNPTTNEIVQSKGIGILISNITATTVSVTSNTFGTYYNITNSGFNGITLPASVPTTSGAYWLFRNNTNTTLSITYTNNGTAITNPQSIPPYNSQTVACSGTGGSSDGYILF